MSKRKPKKIKPIEITKLCCGKCKPDKLNKRKYWPDIVILPQIGK